MIQKYLNAKWHFRTIGMGTINYRAASKRLAREASTTGLFVTSEGYDEKMFKLLAPKFWDDHKEVLKARIPGFGWWIWKSEFIRISLNNIPKGHGLMYCDAGNFISQDIEDLITLTEYFNLASREKIIGSNSQHFIEKDFSPKYLMDRLILSETHRHSSQFLGGFLLIINDSEGKSFVKTWSDLVCEENHKYIIPEVNLNGKEKNFLPSYDQGILSCLLKSQNKLSVQIGDKQINGCVRAVRHRFGYKFIKPNLFSLIYFRIISYASRVRLFIGRRIFRSTLSTRPRNHT
jgi:hypothetical protein